MSTADDSEERRVLRPGVRKARREEEDRQARQAEREGMVRDLETMYTRFKEVSGDYGDWKLLDLSRITCVEFPLDQQPPPVAETFFIPMTKKELDQHPPGFSDKFTRSSCGKPLRWHESDIGRHPASSVFQRHSDARSLCTYMNGLFYTKREISENGSSNMLRRLAGWWPGSFDLGNPESLIDDEFHPDIFNSVIYEPCNPFVSVKSKELPHVMCTLSNGLASRDEALFRSEFMTILAIMITQLRKPPPPDTIVIPVKVLSFFGREGRILEAYYNGRVRRLFIKVSKLQDFSSDEGVLHNSELFLRHMASKCEGNPESPW
ncbi:uncharacterized protein TRUGW13939_01176 [Talaromyces rugulosus]|uniref:Uncharacterized protein n=1 Tax=Talaromyces rugulosus TaxID=121627 RepID=A0A7H8QLJ3_TALRU|nr:uncharacterized protein TRUGW13939_01176 [Talaromyces rugulosus]QKX54093.1 hypothetical protein TRUGW13939_01176 [Talaromyces rugulosus]